MSSVGENHALSGCGRSVLRARSGAFSKDREAIFKAKRRGEDKPRGVGCIPHSSNLVLFEAVRTAVDYAK